MTTITVSDADVLALGGALPRGGFLQLWRVTSVEGRLDYAREVEVSLKGDVSVTFDPTGSLAYKLAPRAMPGVYESWTVAVPSTGTFALSDLVAEHSLDPASLVPLDPFPPSAAEVLAQAGQARDDAQAVAAGLPAAAEVAIAAEAESQLVPLVADAAAQADSAAASKVQAALSAASAGTASFNASTAAATAQGYANDAAAFAGTNNQQVATILTTDGPSRQIVGTVTGATSGLDADATPRFERLGLTPIVTSTTIGQSSIFWPSIIRAADYLTTPLDTYYMYVSTDHGTAGGIFLLTAPKVEGPWTSRGQVYVDVIGQQTETPDVQFIDGKFDMLYQQQFVPGRVANQVTLRATSPDGITWTRQGIAIDLPTGTAMLGEYHTGYHRRTRIANRWISRGLAGGSLQSKQSLWFSNDGKVWKWSGELDYGSPDLAEVSMRRIDLNGYFYWRGRLWGYGRDTNSPASGGVILEEGFACVGPVTNDWMSFAASPAPALTGAAGSWETSTDRGSYVYVDGANVYMLYQKGNSIGIARTAA